MDIELGLYLQVVIIHRKDQDHKKERENANKYKFQGKSAISTCWFDMDHDQLEGKLSKREPNFYTKTLSNEH